MAKLGKATIGALSAGFGGGIVAAHGPHIALENGTLDSVSVYTDGGNNPSTFGVYLDDNGEPGALVAVTAGGNTSAGGWTTLALGGEAITAGTAYWIAHNWSAGADNNYDGGTKNLYFKASAYSAGTLPDPFPASPSTRANRDYSVYLTYTPDSSADGIIATDMDDGRVLQRAIGSNAKDVTFSGFETGTEGTTYEAQILKDSDNSVVVDWTALSGVAHGSGNWSGTLSVPASGDWYNHKVRKKNGGGTVIATSAQTANKWGVGVVKAMIGQSNQSNMFDISSTPPASDSRTRALGIDGVWRLVGGNGAITQANKLAEGTGLVVGLMDFGVGGTAMSAWINSNGTAAASYTAVSLALGATLGCELATWDQGESDAIAGTTKATYKARLADLHTLLLADTGRTAAQLGFSVNLTGTISDATATDATTEAIRQAQLEFATETTGVAVAASSAALGKTDNFHQDAAGLARKGRRWAQTDLKFLGLVSYGGAGPRIGSASRTLGSAVITVGISRDGGSSLEELDTTTDGGSLTGFQVSIDDFANLLTISSTAFNGNNVVLTLSAPPADGDTVKVRYQYGENPTITNPVHDNTRVQGDTIGLPLLPSLGSVTVVVPPAVPRRLKIRTAAGVLNLSV